MSYEQKTSRTPRQRRASKNYNSVVIGLLGEKPIAFNPMLGRVSGSVVAALFLSQLLYWWGKGSNPNWVYKTIQQLKEETCLSRSEQDRAIKIWEKLGVLEVVRRGIPSKRHFSIKEDILIHLLESSSGKALQASSNKFAESDKLGSWFKQTNTESTSENTNKDFFLQKRRAYPKEIADSRKALIGKYKLDRKTYHE